MTQTIFHRVGGTVLDGSAVGYSETLAALDPGRDILLGLFKQAITSELGARWDAIKIGTQLATVDVVETDLPLRPTAQLMQSLKTTFPMLAVYRSGAGTIDEHTLDIERLTQPWELVYVLGPLPPEDIRRLGDVLPAVAKVVMGTVRLRGHPDYNSGALQFFPGRGNFGSCRVVSYEVGQAQFGGGEDAPTYWATQVNLETVEYVTPLDGIHPDLEGASYSMGVGGDGGTLPDLIGFDTDAVPE